MTSLMTDRLLGTALAMMLAVAAGPAWAQSVPFALRSDADPAAVEAAVSQLARDLIADHEEVEVVQAPAVQIRLQLAAGRPADALVALRGFRAQQTPGMADRLLPLEIHAHALTLQAEAGLERDQAHAVAFREAMGPLDDLTAARVLPWFTADLARAQADLSRSLEQAEDEPELSLESAIALVRQFVFLETYRALAPLAPALVAEDDARRYWIETDVLIRTPEGATLSALVVRSRRAEGPRPTALQFNIYTDLDQNLAQARQAAARGYIGMVADARGKRLGTDDIRPFEVEVDDTHAVIDWVSRQDWSNGDVVMWGGSYMGFSAWAATKRLHPSLRAIAVSAAALPGHGLPMENNVFLNVNYAWNFYVGNNRDLDEALYGDSARWGALTTTWFESGRPHREIDAVDGLPNPVLQRQLDHPTYDEYWQAMVPYGEDFARIDIPVLTITGHYDDGQISALHFLREHYRHRPDAEHYLVIGPYDHFGTQAANKSSRLRGYEIDPVAQFDTVALTFAWFDHVLHAGPRPALLRDRINTQVMGANIWRSAPSLEALVDENWTLYLTDQPEGERYRLSRERLGGDGLEQVVDFADRTTQSTSYYPFPIILDTVEPDSGYSFISEPLAEAVELNGSFSGELSVVLNKRDFDFAVVLYEVMQDGRIMQLSHHVGRASHAEDMTRRRLLTPGIVERIPFHRSRMTSRRLDAGSRLLVVVDVIKDEMHQVNHGTGGDVSAESIADAEEPLRLRWGGDSFIRLPITRVTD